jgi:SAM-dependent methyltransferase
MVDYIEDNKMKFVAEDLDEAITIFEGVALPYIRSAVAKAESDNTLVDTFYKRNADHGRIIADYEITVIKEILASPDITRVHEVGCGIASMVLVLGLLGYTTVGIDSASLRIGYAAEILGELEKLRPGIASRVSLVHGSVPAVFDTIDATDAVCVSTNIGAERSDQEVKDFLVSLKSRYKAYMFDVCLFWGVHRTEEAIASALGKIASVANAEPIAFYTNRQYSQYYTVHFQHA